MLLALGPMTATFCPGLNGSVPPSFLRSTVPSREPRSDRSLAAGVPTAVGGTCQYLSQGGAAAVSHTARCVDAACSDGGVHNARLVLDRVEQAELEAQAQRVHQRAVHVVAGAQALLHSRPEVVPKHRPGVHVAPAAHDGGTARFLRRLHVPV